MPLNATKVKSKPDAVNGVTKSNPEKTTVKNRLPFFNPSTRKTGHGNQIATNQPPDLTNGANFRILRRLRNWSGDSNLRRKQRISWNWILVLIFTTRSVPSFQSFSLSSSTSSALHCKSRVFFNYSNYRRIFNFSFGISRAVRSPCWCSVLFFRIWSQWRLLISAKLPYCLNWYHFQVFLLNIFS